MFEKIKKILKNNFVLNSVAIVLSVLLLDTAFVNDSFRFLVLIALIPLFWAINCTKNWKEAYLLVWGWGTFFYMIISRWMFAVYPNDTLGLTINITGIFLIFIAWFLLSLLMGLVIGCFGALVKKLDLFKGEKILFSMFAVSSLWTLMEYFRACFYSLVTWGEGSIIGPFWTMGDLGYLFADNPIFYFARVGGLYGLGFLAVFINVILFFLLRNKKFVLATVLFMAMACLFLFGSVFVDSIDSFYKKNESEPISFILLNISKNDPTFYRYGFSRLIEEDAITPDFQPDVIVFPESFSLFGVMGEIEKPILKKIFPDEDKNGLVITNMITRRDGDRINNIIYRNQKGELVGSREKSFLVPGGETFPVVLKVIMGILNIDSKIGFFEKENETVNNRERNYPVVFEDAKIGTFLCSGILAPNFSRDFIEDGAQIFVNSASHNLWKSHPRFYKELELMVRFEAMAHRRSFLQSTNGGPSFAVDERGVFIKKSSEETDLLRVVVYPQSKTTAYSRMGDMPLIFLSLFIVGWAFIKRKSS